MCPSQHLALDQGDSKATLVSQTMSVRFSVQRKVPREADLTQMGQHTLLTAAKETAWLQSSLVPPAKGLWQQALPHVPCPSLSYPGANERLSCQIREAGV